MKKIFTIIFTIINLIAIIVMFFLMHETHTRKATITNIDTYSEIMTIVDEKGDIWLREMPKEGQKITMKIGCNHGDIEDDYIIWIK